MSHAAGQTLDGSKHHLLRFALGKLQPHDGLLRGVSVLLAFCNRHCVRRDVGFGEKR
jgi:hypothetical protein